MGCSFKTPLLTTILENLNTQNLETDQRSSLQHSTAGDLITLATAHASAISGWDAAPRLKALQAVGCLEHGRRHALRAGSAGTRSSRPRRPRLRGRRTPHAGSGERGAGLREPRAPHTAAALPDKHARGLWASAPGGPAQLSPHTPPPPQQPGSSATLLNEPLSAPRKFPPKN